MTHKDRQRANGRKIYYQKNFCRICWRLLFGRKRLLNNNGELKCYICGQWKSADEFRSRSDLSNRKYISPGSGFRSECSKCEKNTNRKYHQEYNKKYGFKKNKQYRKNNVEKLSDVYIKNLLTKHPKTSRNIITDSMISMKRAQVALHREIKQAKEDLENGFN